MQSAGTGETQSRRRRRGDGVEQKTSSSRRANTARGHPGFAVSRSAASRYVSVVSWTPPVPQRACARRLFCLAYHKLKKPPANLTPCVCARVNFSDGPNNTPASARQARAPANAHISTNSARNLWEAAQQQRPSRRQRVLPTQATTHNTQKPLHPAVSSRPSPITPRLNRAPINELRQ